MSGSKESEKFMTDILLVLSFLFHFVLIKQNINYIKSKIQTYIHTYTFVVKRKRSGQQKQQKKGELYTTNTKRKKKYK